MEITALIREFSEQAGIEDVSAPDGIWRFSADGNVFGVLADEPGEKVLLFGELPAPVPEKAEAFRTAILEANYFFNGTVRENISLTKPSAAGDEIIRAATLAGAHEFIQKLPQG